MPSMFASAKESLGAESHAKIRWTKFNQINVCIESARVWIMLSFEYHLSDYRICWPATWEFEWEADVLQKIKYPSVYLASYVMNMTLCHFVLHFLFHSWLWIMRRGTTKHSDRYFSVISAISLFMRYVLVVYRSYLHSIGEVEESRGEIPLLSGSGQR